jgi:hypothetical protein
MRLSCLIATPNPMTVITDPATLIQSPILIFTGSSTLIIERGRATFTLFLGEHNHGTSLRDDAGSAVDGPAAHRRHDGVPGLLLRQPAID